MVVDAGRVETLKRNLSGIRDRITAAAARSARNADAVRVVVVTKYVDPTVIRALLVAGVRDFGENRVQQLSTRATELGASCERLGEVLPDAGELPRWHMIGHLQRNKVRSVLGCARVIHSVDSLRLAEELARQAGSRDVDVDVFLEVNVSGEASKDGAAPEEAPAIANTLARSGKLRLVGLMTMAPLEESEAARPVFAALRTLRDTLVRRGDAPPTCAHLSMGMSNDYAVAVEEGATVVRIGSAVFEGLNGASRAQTGSPVAG